MPLFWTEIPEAILKFVIIIHKIIRGKYLSMGPQKFGIKRNLVAEEAMRLFEQKAWVRGRETNTDYELMMKDLISHFFPPKELHLQKRYLRRGIYRPRGTKIEDLICRID